MSKKKRSDSAQSDSNPNNMPYEQESTSGSENNFVDNRNENESENENGNANANEVTASNTSADMPFEYKENKIASVLAIIAALFFVVGLGYFVYQQFLKTQLLISDTTGQITSQAASTTRTEDGSNPQSKANKGNEQDNDSSDNIEQNKDSNTKRALEQQQREDKLTTGKVSGAQYFETWRATDYSPGQIQKGSYTVKSGDTLWEIAEAVYGDGSQWVNILNANASSIDYLPSGQQSLIYTGQVLVIP